MAGAQPHRASMMVIPRRTIGQYPTEPDPSTVGLVPPVSEAATCSVPERGTGARSY